jgi:hypothetical protein
MLIYPGSVPKGVDADPAVKEVTANPPVTVDVLGVRPAPPVHTALDPLILPGVDILITGPTELMKGKPAAVFAADTILAAVTSFEVTALKSTPSVIVNIPKKSKFPPASAV